MTNKDSPRPTTSLSQVILDSMDDKVADLLARLDGLTNDEYRWEPAAGMWSVRGTGDDAAVDFDPDRDIDPAPMTTIAWRLWHLAHDCFVEYGKRFDAIPDEGLDASWTLDAADAVERLHRSWQELRTKLAGFDDWFTELGDAFGPWHRHCVADFAMHASNELVHHGAEIATMRDLYRAVGPRAGLTMPLGDAMYSLRAIRRLRPDPIPAKDLETMVDAAIQAPNGGNLQLWHFITVTDRELIDQFAPLYHEAWWAKRADSGYTPETLPDSHAAARQLADEIGDAPAIVLFCAVAKGAAAANAIIPAVQNLLLAGRALGVGGTITTLHPSVEERVHALFGIPETAQVVYAVPLGYPRGRFGPVTRRPLTEVSSANRWIRTT